jgi:nicotinamide mononucleotide transporter
VGTIEFFAVATMVVSVFLAVKRDIWQFPVGIVSTILFLIVFAQVKLYSSASLQVFYIGVQIYGWWYWLLGDRGRRPRITSWPAGSVILLCGVASALAVIASRVLLMFTDASMALLDASIFGLSVAAQTLLSLKKIETWIVWGLVDVIAIWVYASQELWLTTALYVGLLLNVFWGYWEWRKEMSGYAPATQDAA